MGGQKGPPGVSGGDRLRIPKIGILSPGSAIFRLWALRSKLMDHNVELDASRHIQNIRVMFWVLACHLGMISGYRDWQDSEKEHHGLGNGGLELITDDTNIFNRPQIVSSKDRCNFSGPKKSRMGPFRRASLESRKSGF